MPETGEIPPILLRQRAAHPGPERSVLRGSAAFGRVAGVAREVTDRGGLVLVLPLGWDLGSSEADCLFNALSDLPSAAFAFGEPSGGPGPTPSRPPAAVAVSAESLVCRPRDIGPLTIRASEAERLRWPDWGPPDFVLDGALSWSLAAALAVRGGTGLFVPGVRPSHAEPGCSINSLRPEGLAWLTAMALSWGPLGGPSADLAEGLWRRWTLEMAAAGFEGLSAGRASS